MMFLSNGMVIALRLSGIPSARPWAAVKTAVDRVLQARAERQLRLPRMSEEWLYAHLKESAKHRDELL
ncbi:MAG TPA: hypothetical protein VF424_11770 [Vicinamibacterales bacterium]